MSPDASPHHHRGIRSYVLRAGRLTPAQQKALDELMPKWGIPPGAGIIDFTQLFGRKADTIVEIGFGDGDATWRMALAEPDSNFIGIEVHPPGVGRLLRALEEHGISNVRVAMEDAVPFMRDRIAPATLAGVRIFFPDPWPKKRHHKRRLIQSEFVALLAEKLASGAVLHLATDWSGYAEHMLEVMRTSPRFHSLSPGAGYCPRPSWRPPTKYERRGNRLGHETFDLVFERNGMPGGSETA